MVSNKELDGEDKENTPKKKSPVSSATPSAATYLSDSEMEEDEEDVNDKKDEDYDMTSGEDESEEDSGDEGSLAKYSGSASGKKSTSRTRIREMPMGSGFSGTGACTSSSVPMLISDTTSVPTSSNSNNSVDSGSNSVNESSVVTKSISNNLGMTLPATNGNSGIDTRRGSESSGISHFQLDAGSMDVDEPVLLEIGDNYLVQRCDNQWCKFHATNP